MAFSYYPNYGLFQPQTQQFQPVPDQTQQYRQPYQTNQNSGNPIIWVSGIGEASNYLVAPNCAVVLWDSNNPYIYLKCADQSGKTTMKTYELVETSKTEDKKPETAQTISDFRKEIDAIKNELNALKEKVSCQSVSE